MNITLISPRLAVQKGDFLGSGVPYWPIELAILAAHARGVGDIVSVLDLFGADPGRLSDAGDHYLQGVPLAAYLAQPAVTQTQAFVIFAVSYMSHRELLSIVGMLKQSRPDARVAVMENSQAVTAYSLERLSRSFFAAGADLLICGEPIFNWPDIAAFLSGSGPPPANTIAPSQLRPPARMLVKSGHYPVPAWDLFNLQGYWALPYSHGPKSGRFLPILTSRGCPYPCDFCVVPETNSRRWRARSPQDVVDEIIELRDRFGVRHFQVEDLNPTVNHERWEDICRLLISRQAGVFFYLVSGTKAETVHVDKVPLLAQAGCRYISISPESGSSALMKLIGKPFDYRHGIDLVAACHAQGIRTQACFLVGHPSETDADIAHSRDYVRELVRAGLDEIAVFIVAPFAGSALFAQNRIDIGDSGALTSFSPQGRKEYDTLQRRRSGLIRVFFLEKLKRGFSLWHQGLRSVFGRPETKMENLPRRVGYILWRILALQLSRVRGGKV
jgi:hypothetical protein